MKIKTNIPLESFRIIDEFIKEVYGFNLIQKPMDQRILKIKELKEAYDAIIQITNHEEKNFPNDFIRYVYPIIEPAVQWNQLKINGIITGKFLQRSIPKLQKKGNYYGTLFELDMVSRFLLSDWSVNPTIEDYTKKEQQIDFLVSKQSKNETMGIECTTKRSTQDLTIKKINRIINKKSQKFREKNIKKLNVNIDEKILIIDITRPNYKKPSIIPELNKIKLSRKLDNIIFTWREEIRTRNNITLKIKYKNIPDKENGYFSVTYLTELHMRDFSMRKYIEPEPKASIGKWERNPNYRH